MKNEKSNAERRTEMHCIHDPDSQGHSNSFQDLDYQ